MVVQRLIERKRDGARIEPAEWRELMAAYAAGRIPDYQMAALVMAVFLQGMSADETRALMEGMLRSGSTLDLAHLGIPRVARYSQSRQTIYVPKGNRFATLISASRQNFGGELVLEGQGLPQGITMHALPMAANMSQMPVVFEASADAPLGGALVDFTAKLNDPKQNIRGRFTNKADKGRVYVVRANGSVEAREGGSWFSRTGAQMQPGDTVVVPLDAERMRPLPLWTAVTQILYNLAIAAAAVNSF